MSNPNRVLSIILVIALGGGCHQTIGARILGDSRVEIGDMAPEDLKLDPFTVSEVSIDRATLRAVVSSSGGCRAHHYDLYMTPSVFMESFPVQANLYMRHDDDDDPCDAIVVETLTFDLTPIITLYRQMYGPSGQVALNFFDYDQSASTRLILQVE